jgi:peptide/nickel transport system substrate-binding protein
MILLNLANAEVPFFQDKGVRMALLQSLNRRGMIDHLLGGQAIIADGPILPGTWAHYDGLSTVDYDQQEAIIKLKQAGYIIPGEGETIRKKENVSFSFTLIYPKDDLHTALAESIKTDWEQLGIQVNLEAVPYEELINGRLSTRNYQAALVDLNLSRSPDPDPYPFWDQAEATGGQNYSQWDNRVASEYLEQARVTLDLNDRARLYRNFQVVFNEEMPAIPLYNPVYTYAVSNQVQGVRMGPLYDSSDRFETVQDWYLNARMPSQKGGPVPTATPK